LENFQGEAVEFWETYEIKNAIFAFSIFCRVCPEVVFRTFQGQKVLVFSSMGKKVIRAPEVLICRKNKILAKDNSAEKIILNLSAIWKKTKGLPFEERLEASLEEVTKLIKPAENLYLVGAEPLILFLFAYLESQGRVNNLYYQAKEYSLPVKLR